MNSPSDEVERIYARAYPLTPEEERRLESPLLRMSLGEWREFAFHHIPHIIQAYRDGEISLEQALRLARSLSIGCLATDRLSYMGMVATGALCVKPKVLNAKPPRYPESLKEVALLILATLGLKHPELPLAPQRGTNLCRMACDWIEVVQLFPNGNVPEPTTLMGWLRENEKARGFIPKPGRPRKER